MKRGQIFVRGIEARTGKMGTVDILDLDEESFRAWLLDRFIKEGLLPEVTSEHLIRGDRIIYRERNDGISK